ncbi:hypothetical protein RKE30_20245 [Streptomyces sp. Li-HN-5-11]|uniref:hypothetical protein n=1 Tax=Streptomyces sp. Li-HN-5-11 TaxID=3075432 RepID=UPI0028B24AEC|nr:hypothetical protein [Streptomyces sp. Li-HN-5-11]WNM32580.1 hypothetical protein RKE30_20245 [Streptomyces sp. Li-HN-5-11]WOP38672.1 hypothetical protein RKE32_35390 [Streptomyces sp. Li-HN-5-13]
MGRLTYTQRGRGTGWWSSALTLGQFVCPRVVTGLGAVTGGLQPVLAVLGALAAVLAVALLPALRQDAETLVTVTGPEPLGAANSA